MFKSARIKLTVWYSLIIMVVSISFSLAMYRVLTAEFDRVERLERLRIQRGIADQVFIITQPNPNLPPRTFFLDPEVIEDTKNRIGLILLGINTSILGASTLGGYFLAGRTLKPIKDMVDDQNRFLTDASHELRTPLTSMKSEIEVTLRDKHMTLSDTKALLLSNLEEVNSLQTLSDGLIKLTRYQQNGTKVVNFEHVSIKDVVNESLKKINGLVKKKDIKIDNRIKDFIIDGDKITLTEVVTILIDNAIKYSPKKTKVSLDSGKAESFVWISVADQGMGIKNVDLPHVFDRFFRADKSRSKTTVSGYGLGLSIAKEIVERHKGSISVHSEYGHGTTFLVKLPIKH